MKDTEDTRGLTIREIVLEIRADLKTHLDKGHPDTPSRAEMYGTVIAVAGLTLAALRLLF